MLTTVMPRDLAKALSTTSVPVAATAISFRSGNWARVSSRIGTLLMMAIWAPFSRATISSGAVTACSAYSCGKLGGRTVASRVSRSRKTMRWDMGRRSPAIFS